MPAEPRAPAERGIAVTRIPLIPPQGDRPGEEEIMAGFRQWICRHAQGWSAGPALGTAVL